MKMNIDNINFLNLIICKLHIKVIKLKNSKAAILNIQFCEF